MRRARPVTSHPATGSLSSGIRFEVESCGNPWFLNRCNCNVTELSIWFWGCACVPHFSESRTTKNALLLNVFPFGFVYTVPYADATQDSQDAHSMPLQAGLCFAFIYTMVFTIDDLFLWIISLFFYGGAFILPESCFILSHINNFSNMKILIHS